MIEGVCIALLAGLCLLGLSRVSFRIGYDKAYREQQTKHLETLRKYDASLDAQLAHLRLAVRLFDLARDASGTMTRIGNDAWLESYRSIREEVSDVR